MIFQLTLSNIWIKTLKKISSLIYHLTNKFSDQSKTNVDIKSIFSAEYKPETNIINLTLSLPRNKLLEKTIDKENPNIKYKIVK